MKEFNKVGPVCWVYRKKTLCLLLVAQRSTFLPSTALFSTFVCIVYFFHLTSLCVLCLLSVVFSANGYGNVWCMPKILYIQCMANRLRYIYISRVGCRLTHKWRQLVWPLTSSMQPGDLYNQSLPWTRLAARNDQELMIMKVVSAGVFLFS